MVSTGRLECGGMQLLSQQIVSTLLFRSDAAVFIELVPNEDSGIAFEHTAGASVQLCKVVRPCNQTGDPIRPPRPLQPAGTDQ